jgi:hypothetical protein
MKNYTVSTGRVFLGDTGEIGERYVGNSPGLVMTVEARTMTTMKSVNGVLIPNKVHLLSAVTTMSLQLDDISNENLAPYFMSDGHEVEYLPTKGQVVIAVHLGRLYEIRRGGMLSLKAFYGAQAIDIGSNFQVDYGFGVMIPLPNAPDLYQGQELRFEYEAGRSVSPDIGSIAQAHQGSFRYVENNIRGSNRMFFFPEVTITPDQELDLKSASWRSLSFLVQATSAPQVLDQKRQDDYGNPPRSSTDLQDFGDLTQTEPAFTDDYGVFRDG